MENFSQLLMKTIRPTLLIVLLTAAFVPLTAPAQNYSRAKGMARSVAPGSAEVPARGRARPTPPNVPTPVQNPAPAPDSPAGSPPAPAPTRPVPPRPSPAVARPTAPVDPAKAQAAKEEATRKTIEFQKRRAEEGSSTAQHDLGVRYLKGDGVEQNVVKGRELLGESAKNGNTQAVKKLAELDKEKKEEK